MAPLVFLFSEPLAISLYLLENFLQKNCRVIIYTDKPNDWLEKTSHITRTNLFEIKKTGRMIKIPRPDYLIYVDRPVVNSPFFQKIKALLLVTQTGKTIFSDDWSDETVPTLYLNELIGPRMDFGQGPVAAVIKNALNGKKVSIEPDQLVSPLFLGDAAKQISGWLFSFGPSEEEIILAGPELTLTQICQVIKISVPGFSYSLVQKKRNGRKPPGTNVFRIVSDSQKAIKETLLWYREVFLRNAPVEKEKVNKRRLLFSGLAAFLVLPVFLIAVSLGLLFLAKDSFLKGNLKTGRGLVLTANILAGISNCEARPLSRIPFMGGIYRPVNKASFLIKESGEVIIQGLGLAETMTDLSRKILNDEEYRVTDYSQKISSDLDNLAGKLGLLMEDLKMYPFVTQRLDLERINQVLANSSQIAASLPALLGEGTKKTYLVLLQNNMELRPTGGFIGSFALVSFDGGKLIDISVQDVYSADGQLKGHVEPPPPIKKYLNEANWFLRDSNWDSDFPVAAEKAEWFLGKELDVAVDGVAAIDLVLGKDLLALTGPIFLKDFDTEITAENLYAKVQAEVETEFFPGSVKKASFLTALTREIMAVITNDSLLTNPLLGKTIYDNLEERHLQVFVHDNLAGKALANLGWDGSIGILNCSGNCQADWFGLVEANLGVNKANYYIKRKYNLDVSFNGDNVVKNLRIIYENTAAPALGQSGVYRTYFRLLSPLQTQITNFGAGTISENDNFNPDRNIVSGREENGVFFEVLPGQKKEIVVGWAVPFLLNGLPGSQYYLLWRKQAGVGDDPVVLTKAGAPVYNMIFAKNILWKNTF